MKRETFNAIKAQFTLLFLIAISVRDNQKLYDRLNVSLCPTDNRGEAFYATTGAYHDMVAMAEQGLLLPKHIYALYRQFLNDVDVKETGIQNPSR